MKPMCPWASIAAIATVLAAVVTAEDSPNVVRSISRDLPYDENGKLTSHFLLYPDGNPACPAAAIELEYGYQKRPLAGEALRAVFPGGNEGDCTAVCIERGVDRSVAWAAMPHQIYNPANASKPFPQWIKDACYRTEVCLMNYYSQTTPLKLYWVPHAGPKKFHVELKYGERNTKCFSSFLGHVFEAQDGETGQVVDTIRVEAILVKGIGESPPSEDPSRHNIEQEVTYTLKNEWAKHVGVQRTFSPLGFKKGRLPPEIFASMGAFYYNNRHNKVREEWNRKGVFVNWWESNVYLIQVPWDLKRKWQERLRQLVEAWAGVPVEQTDMYGLRQYETGARLLTHVDREPTHAVSLIVNVAQGNLTEPWPVEVQDHADRLHQVTLEPGDIVYYESAKCLHGRNVPMAGEGAYYVNIFTHYRPTGDPGWSKKPNPDWVPEPVLEVDGECHVLEEGGTQRVHCDDARLGDYLSPTLFTATGADDLIDWWRRTTPTADVRDEL